MDDNLSLNELKELIRKFANERDWGQFHNPKDLALALNIELSELLSHFRFKDNNEIDNYIKDFKNKKEIGYELADILYFLIRICDIMEINLSQSFKEKLEILKNKYPIEKFKGSNKKYNEL